MSSPDAEPTKESVRPLSRLEQLLGQQVDFRSAFGAHVTEKDMTRWAEEIKNADIIFVEGVGWGSEQEQSMQEISAGERNPDSVRFNQYDGYRTRFHSLIHETGKAVFFLDIEDTNPLSAEGREMVKTHTEFRKFILSLRVPLDKAVAEYDALIRDFGALNAKREAHILSVIENRLQEAIEKHPELKEKKPLKVLSLFGIAHTDIAHALHSEHPSVKMLLPYSPMTMSPHVELLRKRIWGKEVTEDEKILGFFDFISSSFLPGLNLKGLDREESSSRMSISRAIFNTVPLQDLKHAYALMVDGKVQEGHRFLLERIAPIIKKLKEDAGL